MPRLLSYWTLEGWSDTGAWTKEGCGARVDSGHPSTIWVNRYQGFLSKIPYLAQRL